MKTLDSKLLHVKRLQPNPRLAGLLPPDLAERYHALPVAVEGKRVTVAMAYPEDADARQAVIATLGPSTCLVKADAQEIDRLITVLGQPNLDPRLKIMTWLPVDRFREADRPYAQSVCQLLEGELLPCEGVRTQAQFLDQVAETIPENQVDLLIFRPPNPALYKRILLEPAGKSYLHQVPASLLVLRKPRWPIQQILLVLHEPKSDDSALDWSIRFAKQSQAAVTLLPLIPSPPGMYAHLQARHNLSEILARDYPFSVQLRRAAQHLTAMNINGKLRLRDEALDQQVRCEVTEGNYDLIVVGAQARNAISRWSLGQLVNPLLRWADRPLLITKTRTI